MNTNIMEQFNKRCDELIASQKQSIEKMKVGKKDTGKCTENINNEGIDNKVSDGSENISDNHNDDKLSANENINNEVIFEKVSDGVSIYVVCLLYTSQTH